MYVEQLFQDRRKATPPGPSHVHNVTTISAAQVWCTNFVNELVLALPYTLSHLKKQRKCLKLILKI